MFESQAMESNLHTQLLIFRYTYHKIYLYMFMVGFCKIISILFIYFWLRWVAGCGLCRVAGGRGYPLLWCRLLIVVAFLLVEHLEPRLSSCSVRLAHSLWGLPGPGIEPVSPALAGGFLASGPPGKS